MNKTFFLPLIIVFFAFYYFMFPREGGAELILMPDQAWMLASEKLPDEDLLISRGEQKALFSENGMSAFLPAPREYSVLTNRYYFYKDRDGFILKDLEKGAQVFIKGEGYPLVVNSHIYIVDLWKGRVQEIDAHGKTLWSWQGLGPITALDSAGTGTVLGSLDGSIQFFSNDGVRNVINPAGEVKDCIIYGLALSPDGKRLAVLSGLDDQRVMEYDTENMTLLSEGRSLESRFSRPVKMVYSPDGQILWVEQNDKIIQIGPEDDFLEIPQEGQLLSMGFVESDGQMMILSEQSRKGGGSEYLMNFYTREGALVSSMSFINSPDDIVLRDGRVFFSLGGRILKMTRRNS